MYLLQLAYPLFNGFLGVSSRFGPRLHSSLTLLVLQGFLTAKNAEMGDTSIDATYCTFLLRLSSALHPS